MRNDCAYQRLGRRRPDGFVLVEVMVAAFLAGFLVVPLASSMQSLVSMARDLRSEAARLSAVSLEEGEAIAWTWGPAVASAVWGMGPELKVSVSPHGHEKAVVGAWADGWIVGEWETEEPYEVVVSDLVWSDMAGKELVIRVRDPQGQWGPPWRSIVPDAWGALPAERAAPPVEDPGNVWAGGEDSIMVHVPSFSAPELKSSWTTTPVCGSALGLCLAVADSGSGWCELEVGGRCQSWHSSEGRCLDVYF